MKPGNPPALSFVMCAVTDATNYNILVDQISFNSLVLVWTTELRELRSIQVVQLGTAVGNLIM
jgi:hypothetical protein